MTRSTNQKKYRKNLDVIRSQRWLTNSGVKLIVLLGLLTSFSCKKYDLENWSVSYPKEVEEQMNLFLDYAPQGIQAKQLTIKLTDELFVDGKKVSGLCSGRKKTIYLDTTSMLWHSARTRLVMHELGHFVLRREHLNDTTTILKDWQGFPASFMMLNSSRPSDWNLQRVDLLDYYMQELFRPYIPKASSEG
jgi:hypothetical protein